MNKYLILIFAILTLASCGVLKPKPLYQPHQLLSIQAIDLSEDKSTLSTQNDEILVSIIFGSKIEGAWYANGYSLPLHVFDNTAMLYTPDSVTLSTDVRCQNCEVWICLTELDEDNSDSTTHEKLLTLINSLGYRALDSKAIVDDTIADNDFLGYARVPYFTKKLPTSYIISGQDLLDRYAYKVTIRTTPFILE